jgi:hypothetical protein
MRPGGQQFCSHAAAMGAALSMVDVFSFVRTKDFFEASWW